MFLLFSAALASRPVPSTGVLDHRGHGHGHLLHRSQTEFGEGVVGGKEGLFQIALQERIRVEDHHGVLFDVFDVDLQGSGVHGHQDVGLVAGGVHSFGAQMYLEARYAAQGAFGRAHLGRIVREGGDAVPDECREVGEHVAYQLHAVARVAGKADDHLFQFFDFGCF